MDMTSAFELQFELTISVKFETPRPGPARTSALRPCLSGNVPRTLHAHLSTPALHYYRTSCDMASPSEPTSCYLSPSLLLHRRCLRRPTPRSLDHTRELSLTSSRQSSEARLYTFSDETKTKLRKFRLGTSRAKDPQAVICMLP